MVVEQFRAAQLATPAVCVGVAPLKVTPKMGTVPRATPRSRIPPLGLFGFATSTKWGGTGGVVRYPCGVVVPLVHRDYRRALRVTPENVPWLVDDSGLSCSSVDTPSATDWSNVGERCSRAALWDERLPGRAR